MRIIISIIIIAISQLVNAQLNLVDVKAVERCTGDPNIYQLEILLKANESSGATYIAEQNYRLQFNPLALKGEPKIVDQGVSFTGIILNGPQPTLYSEHNLNGTQVGENYEGEMIGVVSYNIELGNGTGTLLSNNEWSLVGVIEFDVLNLTLPKELTWLGILPDDFPPTFISENINGIRTKMQPNFYPTEVAGNNTALLSAFGRTWKNPCTGNEGWLKIDWQTIADEDELFISIDGGINYTTVLSSSGQFVATNLTAGDYDIRIKLSEDDCPTILDDVNLINTGFEATMEHDFSCENNEGFITINWPPSPYTNAIKININNGKMISVNDELGTYTFNNLKAGNYGIKVYNKGGSCVTDLGVVELNGANDAPEITRNWEHTDCGQSNGSITLSWVDNPNVEQIQISTDGANSFTTMPDIQQTYTVNNLTVGNYDIWIKWGAEADACAIQLDDVNLINTAPANTGLEMQYACEDKKTSFVETGYTDVTAHQFRYRVETGDGWLNWTNTKQTFDGTINITEMPNDVSKMQYRVRVQCDGFWSMWSVPKTAAMPSCKLSSATNFLPVTVVPNPFNNRFQINISNNLFKTQMAKIELTNLIGKTVYTKMVNLKEGENSFNLEPESSISAGIYLANILLDDGTKRTVKLLKR